MSPFVSSPLSFCSCSSFMSPFVSLSSLSFSSCSSFMSLFFSSSLTSIPLGSCSLSMFFSVSPPSSSLPFGSGFSSPFLSGTSFSRAEFEGSGFSSIILRDFPNSLLLCSTGTAVGMDAQGSSYGTGFRAVYVRYPTRPKMLKINTRMNHNLALRPRFLAS